MTRVKLKDMSYADRNEYKYRKKLLTEIRMYGTYHLKERTEKVMLDIEKNTARRKIMDKEKEDTEEEFEGILLDDFLMELEKAGIDTSLFTFVDENGEEVELEDGI